MPSRRAAHHDNPHSQREPKRIDATPKHTKPFTRIASALGLKRSFTIDGIKYRERSPAPDGSQRFEARFPDGRTMRLTPSNRRIYADITPDPRIAVLRRFDNRIHPGSRVLELGCGCGASSAMLAERLGSAGSVIAIGYDPEMLRYARRRYAAPNIGFESPTENPVAWEDQNAFGTVIAHLSAMKPATALEAERDRIASWIRVLERPGLIALTGDADLAPELTLGGRIDELARGVVRSELRATSPAPESSAAATVTRIEAEQGWSALVIELPARENPTISHGNEDTEPPFDDDP